MYILSNVILEKSGEEHQDLWPEMGPNLLCSAQTIDGASISDWDHTNCIHAMKRKPNKVFLLPLLYITHTPCTHNAENGTHSHNDVHCATVQYNNNKDRTTPKNTKGTCPAKMQTKISNLNSNLHMAKPRDNIQ